MDNGSLVHSKWNCKYHIALVPNYRRQLIYRKEYKQAMYKFNKF